MRFAQPVIYCVKTLQNTLGDFEVWETEDFVEDNVGTRQTASNIMALGKRAVLKNVYGGMYRLAEAGQSERKGPGCEELPTEMLQGADAGVGRNRMKENQRLSENRKSRVSCVRF